MRIKDIRVSLDKRNEEDKVWDLPEYIPGKDSLLIYHEPFGLSNNSNGYSMQDLKGSQYGPIFSITFPHGLGEPLSRELEEIALEALTEPWYASEYRAAIWASIMNPGDRIYVDSGEDVKFSVEIESVRTDFTSFHLDFPIIQLPLGECWVTCRPVTSSVHIDNIGVNEGVCECVEIGIGTNPKSIWLRNTVYAEKTVGAVHLGFGDSELIGGSICNNYHYDIGLIPPTRVLIHKGHKTSKIVDQILAQIVPSGHSSVNVLSTIDEMEDKLTELELIAYGTTEGEKSIWIPPTVVEGYLSNVETLPYVGDARRADVVAVKAEAVRGRIIGKFKEDGRVSFQLGERKYLECVFDIFVEYFGPIPWPECNVWAADLYNVHALSLPGLIFISNNLCEQPLRMQWLYLCHELVHQWLGGMITVRDGSKFIEAAIDVIVIHVVHAALGDGPGAVLIRNHVRGSVSDVESVSEHSQRVLTLWNNGAWGDVLEWAVKEVAWGRSILNKHGIRYTINPDKLKELIDNA